MLMEIDGNEAAVRDREIINIQRMQASLAKKLVTPNCLSKTKLAECSMVAYELDARVSEINSVGSCHLLEDFQLKQKDLWRILTHIHSTSHTYSPHSDKQQTTEITNSNPVNITQRISENEQKKSDVTPSKSKQGLISVPKANSATKVAAGEDISSSADIQTLLLQQKHISVREMAQEEKTQSELTNELLDLTSLLKENTIMMNETINIQNTQLAEMYEHAEDNVEELDEQKDKMNQQQALQSSSLWTTVYALVTVFALFSVTYAVIRIFPKP